MAKIRSFTPAQIIEQFNKLKSQRANWESLWQEIAEYVLPARDDVQFWRTPGEKKYTHLLDSTATTECELLAGALHGMLTNPSGFFFGLTTGDALLDMDDAARNYMQQCVRIMHDSLNASNFQTEVHELYLNLIAFGFSPMSMEEDPDTDVRFANRSIREVYLKENSHGVVDTIFRNYKAYATDLVDDFGYDELPKKIQEAYDKGKTDQWEVIYACYPKRRVTGADNSVHSFVSQYVLVAEKLNLEVSGFRDSPWLTPRWSKANGETYGRGPGDKALPEAKVVNKMTETTLRGAQKVVDPPLQVPDDGFIMNVNTKPGGLTFYRAGSNDRVEKVFDDARIDFGFQSIEMKQKQIRAAFYSDQLKLREGPQMTATEVSERVEQALRFLGPMLGRQQREFLAPLVERLYGILVRKGKLPEVPAILENKPLKIQYTSVMAMSQRLSELQSIGRTMQNIAPFASADPTTLDVFNGQRAAKYIAKLVNFPQEILNSKEEMAQIAQSRQQAQAAAQQAQQQAMENDTVSKVGGAAAKFQPKVV